MAQRGAGTEARPYIDFQVSAENGRLFFYTSLAAAYKKVEAMHYTIIMPSAETLPYYARGGPGRVYERTRELNNRRRLRQFPPRRRRYT